MKIEKIATIYLKRKELYKLDKKFFNKYGGRDKDVEEEGEVEVYLHNEPLDFIKEFLTDKQIKEIKDNKVDIVRFVEP